MLHVVIMAGGSGTRFWPESRRTKPKQFLRFMGEQTLLQQAFERCSPWVPPERTWVVTNAAYVAETARQLPRLPEDRILAEPCGRNTAPCIGLAAVRLLHEDPEAVMLVMPADHIIGPPAAFLKTVQAAVDLIESDPQASVLFGVKPTFPSTGFGYIERGTPVESSAVDTPQSYRVASFREKPDHDVARQFVDAGRYYWNCGIFVWRAAQIRTMIAEFQPEIDRHLDHLAAGLQRGDWDASLQAEFPLMPKISIDHGVLERARQVYVLEAAFDWDDVGSWDSLGRMIPVDENSNILDGPHSGFDTRNCIIRSQPGHLIATIGLENCIVVHTPDATLIARKDDENAMRRLVTLLEEQGLEQFL